MQIIPIVKRGPNNTQKQMAYKPNHYPWLDPAAFSAAFISLLRVCFELFKRLSSCSFWKHFSMAAFCLSHAPNIFLQWLIAVLRAQALARKLSQTGWFHWPEKLNFKGFKTRKMDRLQIFAYRSIWTPSNIIWAEIFANKLRHTFLRRKSPKIACSKTAMLIAKSIFQCRFQYFSKKMKMTK